jgi:flagellar hook assembly protein FlgD
VAAFLSQSASWSLTIKDSGGASVRSFSGSGVSIAQDWNGTDTSGATVAGGVYTAELAASVSGGPTAAPVIGQITVNSASVVARIQDPTPLEVVPGASIPVQGTANGTSFASYTLDYAVGADPTASFSTISTGTSPIASGQVGAWNTSGLLGGIYTLRLRSFATGGGATAEDRITVKVLRVVGPDQDDYFSPNGDNVQDQGLIQATATVDTDWVVTVSNAQAQVIRTLQGQGALVRAFWDGQTDGTVLAPDGPYTYTISVGGGLAQVGGAGPTVIDTVAPQSAFTAPAGGAPVLTYDPVTITGTASDLNLANYNLSYRLGTSPSSTTISTGTSSVTDSTLGELSPGTPDNAAFVDEPLTLRLLVKDRAGNQSAVERPLSPQLITITNVSSAPVYFDPFASGTGTFSYKLNRLAYVTIEFYPSQSAPVAPLAGSIVDGASRTSGTHSELWDGKDGDTGIHLPIGAYFYSILATDGMGGSARFNNPNAPALWGPSTLFDLKINGASANIPTPVPPTPLGVVVDPYRNDELHIEWLNPGSVRCKDNLRLTLADSTQISLSSGPPGPARTSRPPVLGRASSERGHRRHRVQPVCDVRQPPREEPGHPEARLPAG